METNSSYLFLLLLIALLSPEAKTAPRAAPNPLDTRVAVAPNSFPSDTVKYTAFSTDFQAGKVRASTSEDAYDWEDWVDLETTVTITSNPVVANDNRTGAIQVFVQGTDGQVYMYKQTGTGAASYTEIKLSTSIPTTLQPSSFSLDPIQAIVLSRNTHLFARSQSNTSRLYWSWNNGSDWSDWVAIGDSSDYLAYDPYVAVNSLVDRLEVYGVFQSGYLLHTWQNSQTSFTDKWHKLGGLFSPKFNSAPVIHQMGYSFFNGMLAAFVRGEDGVVHRIQQTTCDKVKNPWGPCTWDLFFSKLGGAPPSDKSSRNPFIASRNIHLGIEVFTVGASDKHLYHIWQLERDSSWSDWDDIGMLSPSSGFASQPYIILDVHGWWQAFAVNSSGQVSRYVQNPLKFVLSKDSVAFNQNVTVSWAIPTDEATHKDWIGVYPSGAPGHGYVDYAYVGGSQNPLKDPVPQGALTFTTVLTDGQYEFRYMVNKEYDSVLQAPLTAHDATKDLEWVQLYRGIARGLGSINANITLCVEDGNRTVETFIAAFQSFEDRKIFEGLHLLASGLSDFRDALIQCNETVIIKDLTKFIENLIACTEDACVNFLIDIGVELIILYEHIYEIYGDILGAKNSFDILAYEQGGICVGRVTHACLTLQ